MIVLALLATFTLIAWSAVTRHSATIDEPMHAASAFLQTFRGDFRMDAEDPPLWKYWAMLPHRADGLPAVPITTDALIDPAWNQYGLSTRWLFETPQTDGTAFVNRSRAMMLTAGVALGALIAAWAWRLAGTVAAIVACGLFTFDPNFLAHAPLVKNDVSLSLVLFALALVAWSVGRRARAWNVLLLCILCGVAVTVKFSGVLAAPIVATLLLTRSLSRDEWIVLGHAIRTRSMRWFASAGICALAAVVSVTMIWASYRFRYRPAASHTAMLDLVRQVEAYRAEDFYVRNHRWPNEGELSSEPVPLPARLAIFADDHRLFPQAWTFGLLFTYRSTLVRPTFLLGQRDDRGHWYYFPLAMLFKTPIATIAAAASALIWIIRRHDGERWAFAALLVPLLIYLASALTSNLNIGVRHVLPVYPFAYVLIGLAAAQMYRRHARRFVIVAALLGGGLVVETTLAFPHYISFFNVVSRPHRLHLLSDSNLDWGQDLSYVAKWQERHAQTRLYLGYAGPVDPAFYGIQYVAIPGGVRGREPVQWPPRSPGVIAISATLLQGVNCPSQFIELYAPLRAREPDEIIGDTIYVYEWPPRERTRRKE